MFYSEMQVYHKERRARLAACRRRSPTARVDQALRGSGRLGLACLVLALIALALLAGCSSDRQYRDTGIGMTTNGPVDLKRYQGLWYEIARFPNRFEEGCAGVTAEYTLNEDGSVKVLNTCRQGGLDGPVETAEGVATSTNADNDKLDVTFVPWLPFARGDYWVLETDYQVAVIGAPGGTTGWVLARTPVLAKDRLQQALGVLQQNGYDTAKLTFTEQPPQ